MATYYFINFTKALKVNSTYCSNEIRWDSIFCPLLFFSYFNSISLFIYISIDVGTGILEGISLYTYIRIYVLGRIIIKFTFLYYFQFQYYLLLAYFPSYIVSHAYRYFVHRCRVIFSIRNTKCCRISILFCLNKLINTRNILVGI